MKSIEMVIVIAYCASALFHQLGHTLAGELLEAPTTGVKLGCAGICIVHDTGSPLSNLFISSAGPLMNLLIGVVSWPAWKLFAIANLSMFLLSIVPIAGSDGDRVWTCAEKMGWIEEPKPPRRGLGKRHEWLLKKGYSRWDLERLELADEKRPPARSEHLQKMEYRNYLSLPVTRNSCSQ